MPPTDRYVPRFSAEPPQEGLPYGRWAHRLSDLFYSAGAEVEGDGEDLGEPGDIAWHPDRTYGGRTYVPATAPTSTGHELFGYVSFVPAGEDGEPSDFEATADVTSETADRHPEWKIDLTDEAIASWRGEEGKVASIALVWGRPLVAGAAIATAELAGLAVDQCVLVEERFTLIAPDDYRGDLLDVRVFDRNGRELASESLYEDDGEDAPDAEDG
ncbi:MAG TPA: hypothetical protein VNB64_04480 [Solirubrobacteraceae bacterium]|nr:hypothetical protein [Solirubrobacteraceae bacterium]